MRILHGTQDQLCVYVGCALTRTKLYCNCPVLKMRKRRKKKKKITNNGILFVHSFIYCMSRSLCFLWRKINRLTLGTLNDVQATDNTEERMCDQHPQSQVIEEGPDSVVINGVLNNLV